MAQRKSAKPGQVEIRSTDPPIRIIAWLSSERPNVDSGYGGWSSVTRPRRSPLTTWTAAPQFHMTLPIMLDGFRAGRSVEREIGQLSRLGFPTAADGTPPRLTISTTGAAIPGQSRVWVIDTLTWGDAVMNRNGNRIQQQVTLSLMEYVADVHLVERSAANRQRTKAAAAKSRPGAASKRVVAKASGRTTASGAARAGATAMIDTAAEWGLGEDLLRIAADQLGDANRWPEIAALNGVRDPRSITPGQVIRLP